jgi:hypothetical protein
MCGNEEQLPHIDSASRANSHTVGRHHGAKAPEQLRLPGALVHVGRVRTAWGDRKLGANCSYPLAPSFLSPQTVHYSPSFAPTDSPMSEQTCGAANFLPPS